MAFEDEIQQGEQFVKDDEPQKAEPIYRSILKRDPNQVEAARLLAGIAVLKDRLDDAEVFLRRAASVAPDYGRVWVDLTNVLRDQDKLDDALASALEVLRLAPDTAESHVLYGSVVGKAGRHEDAISSYRKALTIAPAKAGVRCTMAHHMKTLGHQDEAIATYRQSISTKADHAEAYWSLANLKTFRFEEAEIAAMQSLLNRDDLPDESRVQVHNALGFDSEARNDYDEAFSHFEQCNLIRRKAEKYDPVQNETVTDQFISVFNTDLFEKSEINWSVTVSF
jgi:tetratricopeptide (TPR) repeat protein